MIVIMLLPAILVFMWIILLASLIHLICIAHFKGGPYTATTWEKHKLKLLTIWYWKMLARYKKGQVVVLLDFQDSIYVSISHPSESNPLLQYSYTYYNYKVGPLELHADGTVTKDSQDYYIKNWLPLRVEERIAMILTYDAKNFDLVVV